MTRLLATLTAIAIALVIIGLVLGWSQLRHDTWSSDPDDPSAFVVDKLEPLRAGGCL